MPETIVHSDGGTPEVVLGGIVRQVIEVQIPGLQGRPGIGIELRGVYPDFASLNTAHPVGDLGQAYIVGPDLYVWNVDSSTWSNAGPFRGTTGADGKPGQIRFTGQGDPGTIIGAQPLDTYLDTLTGTVHTLL